MRVENEKQKSNFCPIFIQIEFFLQKSTRYSLCLRVEKNAYLCRFPIGRLHTRLPPCKRQKTARHIKTPAMTVFTLHHLQALERSAKPIRIGYRPKENQYYGKDVGMPDKLMRPVCLYQTRPGMADDEDGSLSICLSYK